MGDSWLAAPPGFREVLLEAEDPQASAHAAGPNAVIALFTYDGEGNLTGTGTSKVNGNVSHFTLTGTYAVDEDYNVSDTVLFPGGATATHQSVIVHNGMEFFFLNSTPGTATSGNVSVGKKQFPRKDD